MVEWSYFDKFDEQTDRYMLPRGEGETMASQTVTAVAKLVYKWYNDGDVFDNTYNLEGWWNDLSDFANWLAENTKAAPILGRIKYCYDADDYEHLLKKLADVLLDSDYLAELEQKPKTGTIYECKGPYKFDEKLLFGVDEEDY